MKRRQVWAIESLSHGKTSTIFLGNANRSPLAIHNPQRYGQISHRGSEMAQDKVAVKGTASMWALSSDRRTVRLTVPPLAGGESSMPTLRVEFDRSSLEATLSALVQMHFEMLRTAPADVQYVKH